MSIAVHCDGNISICSNPVDKCHLVRSEVVKVKKNNKNIKLIALIVLCILYLSCISIDNKIEKLEQSNAILKNTIKIQELQIRKFDDKIKEMQKVINTQSVNRGSTRRVMKLPSADTTFKSYMDYRMISSVSSKQYALQKKCWTDQQGFRRYGDDYCVALGSYYVDEIGDRFEVTLASGKIFTCIAADLKADSHTDTDNMYKPISNQKGNMLEFIIDSEIMNDDVLRSGTMCEAGFQGNVVTIVKIEE